MFLVPIQHRLYDRRGCGSYLKRRLLLAWLRNKILYLVPHCSIALHLSSLEWGILFILLLIGLPQERCPSGLWRKSYDRQWPYVPKWNKRATLYLLKPSSTSCLILFATSNCSSRTIIWIYISLPQASMQIGKSTTFISNNPWSLWNKLVKSLLR